MTDADARIDAILLDELQSSGLELSADELEQRVSRRMQQAVDTFDVREAIWRLIEDKSVILTSRWTFKATS